MSWGDEVPFPVRAGVMIAAWTIAWTIAWAIGGFACRAWSDWWKLRARVSELVCDVVALQRDVLAIQRGAPPAEQLEAAAERLLVELAVSGRRVRLSAQVVEAAQWLRAALDADRSGEAAPC